VAVALGGPVRSLKDVSRQQDVQLKKEYWMKEKGREEAGYELIEGRKKK